VFQKILVLGELEKGILRRMHIPQTKIEIFSNGVDSEHFEHHNPSSFLSKYKIKGQYLCYLGRIHPTKGLEFLLRSFAKIDGSSQLVVAGTGDPTYIESLRALGTRLGLRDRVVFTGYIFEDEKLQMLEGCDGLVLPSKYEPFGISLLEAMAHSKPVVATYPGGTDFVVHSENGFLLRYGDEKNLTDFMSTMLHDFETSRSMGRKGFELAKNSTWDHVVNRLEEIYEEVAN